MDQTRGRLEALRRQGFNGAQQRPKAKIAGGGLPLRSTANGAQANVQKRHTQRRNGLFATASVVIRTVEVPED